MAREYKKGIFTLKEISVEAMRKYPGRWTNPESAYASVKTAARQLGIGDINGKKKYKQIAAVDVARVFEILEKTNRPKKKTAGQADLFSLLPEPVKEPASNKDAFSYKAKPAPAQINKTVKAVDIQATSIEELAQLADELTRAFCNLALALRNFPREA